MNSGEAKQQDAREFDGSSKTDVCRHCEPSFREIEEKLAANVEALKKSYAETHKHWLAMIPLRERLAKVEEDKATLAARVAELAAQVAEWKARTIREGEERDRLREALASLINAVGLRGEVEFDAVIAAEKALAGPAPEGKE